MGEGMKISDGKAVQIDYTLRNDKGAVLDSSEGRDPLAYLHGAGNIIPGLEAALTGKEPGDTLAVTIPAAEAYGEREDDLVTTVERALFPDPKQVQLGMRLRVQLEEGTRLATVSAMVGDKVTLDMNHPLAGETLHFDVEVMDVKDATPEEQAHGHAHGAHGHSH